MIFQEKRKHNEWPQCTTLLIKQWMQEIQQISKYNIKEQRWATAYTFYSTTMNMHAIPHESGVAQKNIEILAAEMQGINLWEQ